MRGNTTTASVTSKLPDPREEIVLIKAQILPKLEVGHLVRAGALVEPADLDVEEASRLLNGQE